MGLHFEITFANSRGGLLFEMGLLFEILRNNYSSVYRQSQKYILPCSGPNTKLFSLTLYPYFISFYTLNKLTFGLTMLPFITNWTITSVACSVSRHRRYTFATIQTRVRRYQAAMKSRYVSSTILSTINLEKR